MKPEQDKIYYLVADNYATAKNSPHLEVYKKKGVEVLLMTDRVDEWAMGHLTEFSDKKLQAITQGDLDLGGLESDAGGNTDLSLPLPDDADLLNCLRI